MSRALAACGVILFASVLAGCGGSHPVPDAAHGSLYRYGNGEAFIQWQRDGQKLHGTISETTITCCEPMPARLVETTHIVNGTISGSKVFLHLLNGVRWNGTLHSYGLFVRYEHSQGRGVPLGIRYRRASGSDYNAALAQTKAAFQRQNNG